MESTSWICSAGVMCVTRTRWTYCGINSVTHKWRRNGTNTKTHEGIRHGKGDAGVGVLQGIGREREPGEVFDVTPQYIIDGAWLSQTPARYGEIRGGGGESGTYTVSSGTEAFKTETKGKEDTNKKGRWSMNVWANWLRPAPSYFDRITAIVEQLVELECDMRDGENAAHNTLNEIEAARREISVRIRRA